MATMKTVEEFRAGLAPEDLAIVDRLRTLASSAAAGLEERIKWNAPSFALGDVDRITLGLERKGGVRVVLHRGAKSKPTAGFAFEAPGDLVRWPAPDRGVMTFSQASEIDRRKADIGDIFRRWLATD